MGVYRFQKKSETWDREKQFPANDKWVPAGFVAECRVFRDGGRGVARLGTRKTRMRKIHAATAMGDAPK
jgi:hypothetical protein